MSCYFLSCHINSRMRGLSLNWSNGVWGDCNMQKGQWFLLHMVFVHPKWSIALQRGMSGDWAIIYPDTANYCRACTFPNVWGGHGCGMFLQLVHKASVSIQLEGKTAKSCKWVAWPQRNHFKVPRVYNVTHVELRPQPSELKSRHLKQKGNVIKHSKVEKWPQRMGWYKHTLFLLATF